MSMNSGRNEKRVSLAVPLWLSSLRRPGLVEKVITDNISPAGASVIAAERWDAHEEIAVLCPPMGITSAEIVYRQPLVSGQNDQFAVGIHLKTPVQGWPVEGTRIS
jgi:hypothetical protein